MSKMFLSYGVAALAAAVLATSSASAQRSEVHVRTNIYGPILIQDETTAVNDDEIENLMFVEIWQLDRQHLRGQRKVEASTRAWEGAGEKKFYRAELKGDDFNSLVVVRPEFPSLEPDPTSALEVRLYSHMGEYLLPVKLRLRPNPAIEVLIVANSLNPSAESVRDAIQKAKRLSIEGGEREFFHAFNLLLRHFLKGGNAISEDLVRFIEFIDWNPGFSKLTATDRFFLLYELAKALTASPNPDTSVDRNLTVFHVAQRAFAKAIAVVQEPEVNIVFSRIVSAHSSKYLYECENEARTDCIETIYSFLSSDPPISRETAQAFLKQLVTEIELETDYPDVTGEAYIERVRQNETHFHLWMKYLCLLPEGSNLLEHVKASRYLNSAYVLVQEIASFGESSRPVCVDSGIGIAEADGPVIR